MVKQMNLYKQVHGVPNLHVIYIYSNSMCHTSLIFMLHHIAYYETHHNIFDSISHNCGEICILYFKCECITSPVYIYFVGNSRLKWLARKESQELN